MDSAAVFFNPFFLGWVFCLAMVSLIQDWHGGLEAYVEYLRGGGWLGTPWWIWVIVMAVVFVIGLRVRWSYMDLEWKTMEEDTWDPSNN